jgi:hypothetical protein
MAELDPKPFNSTIAGDTTAPPKKRVAFSAVSASGSVQRRRNRRQLRLIERVFKNKMSPGVEFGEPFLNAFPKSRTMQHHRPTRTRMQSCIQYDCNETHQTWESNC